MKNKNTNNIVASLIERAGGDIKNVAIASGVDLSLLYKIVSDNPKTRRPLSLASATKLSEYFSRTLNEVVTVDMLLGLSLDETKEQTGGNFVMVPVLGTVRAGKPLLAEENVIGYECIDRQSVSGGDYFYLAITGDSMIDEGIFPGGRVLVRKQDWTENNQIAVVLVNNLESTIKRVKWVGKQVILYAANKNYEPQIYDIEDIKIIGRVVKSEKSH